MKVHVKHYKSSNEGIILKRKYLDWKDMLCTFKKENFFQEKALLKHLSGNYAVGLLKTDTLEKYYYSSTRIKDENQFRSFKDHIARSGAPTAIKEKWLKMVQDLYYTSPFVFKYINVDRSRGIRTEEAFPRFHDSESKIIENMSDYMFTHGIANVSAYIYTHKEPCLNCELVFQQFIDRYPLSEITIFYNQLNYVSVPSKYNWRY
ncbi:deaminase domain-containing protein [Cohnella soli]|uniref:Deaminase domain-containing protein n=1 Tax=Cohnella soli TaxID=425005 RepID=A0ABW0I665_9BACL